MSLELLAALCSVIEFTSGFVLVFLLFRLPVKENLFKMVTISSIMSFFFSSDIYFLQWMRDFPPVLSVSLMLVVIIMSIFTLFKLPLLYSIIITVCCAISGMLIEFIIMSILINTESFTHTELVKTNSIGRSIMTLSASVSLLILSLGLFKANIGFFFMKKQLNANKALKGYNFIISVIAVFGTFVPIVIYSVSLNTGGSFLYFIVLMAILLFVICNMYWQNNKLLEEQYKDFNIKF